jgi:hypothetical protein
MEERKRVAIYNNNIFFKLIFNTTLYSTKPMACQWILYKYRRTHFYKVTNIVYTYLTVKQNNNNNNNNNNNLDALIIKC